MKHWQETGAIARHILKGLVEGQNLALATVVDVQGSAYRRPGAKLLIDRTSPSVGGVSGGCLEDDVRLIGLDVIDDRVPRLRRYHTGANDASVWGLGLGCEGTVEILIQPLAADATRVWERVAGLLEGNSPFSLATVLSGPQAGDLTVIVDGHIVAGSTGDNELDRALERRARSAVAVGQSRTEYVDAVQVFTDVLSPPPWLIIFGAGDDAVPLERVAALAGMRIAVVDHRSGYLTTDRFPEATRLVEARNVSLDIPLGEDSFAIVMTHSVSHDRRWVGHLVNTAVPYIGVLGPRERLDRMLAELAPQRDDKIFGPVGLDIGADGPEQIAVSIVAEVLACRSGRCPVHTRDRKAASIAI